LIISVDPYYFEGLKFPFFGDTGHVIYHLILLGSLRAILPMLKFNNYDDMRKTYLVQKETKAGFFPV
jgi:hypothetical protein